MTAPAQINQTSRQLTADSRPAAAAAPFVERGRDLRIDFLRGLFVLAMVIDHVAGPSWLYAITGGNRFYTSAAEGFIFVSGLVGGRAYTRAIERAGLNAGLVRILKRAGQLYLLAIVLTLAFAAGSEIFHLPWAFGWNLHDSVGFVVGVLTLHRTYYLVDVLAFYVLVLLAASVVFVPLTNGLSWAVLGASWLLWLTYQVFPELAGTPWPIVGNNLFTFSAWQVLFFTGLVIGYEWERWQLGKGSSRVVGAIGGRMTDKLRTRLIRCLAVVLAIGILLYVFQGQVLGWIFRAAPDPALAQATLTTSVFGKSELRLGRLVAFAVVFVLLFLVTTTWWRQIRYWSGWLFLPLGQNALYAYAAHVVVVFAVAYGVQRFSVDNALPAAGNAVVQIASVLLIWGLVQLRPLRIVFSSPWVCVAAPAAGIAALILLPQVMPDIGESLSSATASSGGASAESVNAVTARAFGTSIPVGVIPSVPEAASAPPQPEEAASTPAPAAATAAALPGPVSDAAGKIQGTLLEPEFQSAALNAKQRYFIYLPPNYQTSGQRYPVLYMLHGEGGRSEWIGNGLIGKADAGIVSGQLPAMIIVLPQGDLGYWVNHQNNGPRWGDYLTKDLVQLVDTTYPTLTTPKYRAIGGMSMGGYGALYNGFTQPALFGIVGAHAPSLRDGNDKSLSFLPRGSAFDAWDPVNLAGTAPGIEGLRIWIDTSDGDPWKNRAQDLHNRLVQRHIPDEWHTFSGTHGGSYWSDHTQQYLDFYGRAFRAP
ncbi:MAG: OpgC domain-containing protein [Chloroflexi bacterium]|nr:OpgC domain-containing protein [Chloroflexota bacterium]